MQSGPWTWREEPATVTRMPVRTSEPRYTPSDILTLLWRRLPWMILAFLVIALIGAAVALRMPKTYAAHSSLLIRLSPEYVYQPKVGDAARGATPDNDQVVQSELEILNSDAVKIRVVNDIGLARLYPDLGKSYATASPEKRDALQQAAVRAITSGLKVAAAPDTAIARLSYTDKDPERAALVLNTLVDEYLRYRKTVLVDRNIGPLEQERRVFQIRLDQADADYQKFLADNGVGDFDTEKASLSQLYGQLLTESYSVGAQISEAEGRLGVTSHEAAGAQQETLMYRDLDHTAQDKLMQMKSDRQDLLSRYQSSAQPVKELDQKIAAQEDPDRLRTDEWPGRAPGRTQPDLPVPADGKKTSSRPRLRPLRDRKATLDHEIADITARRQKLAGLEPQYQELARQRDLLTTINVRNLVSTRAGEPGGASLGSVWRRWEREGDPTRLSRHPRLLPSSWWCWRGHSSSPPSPHSASVCS